MRYGKIEGLVEESRRNGIIRVELLCYFITIILNIQSVSNVEGSNYEIDNAVEFYAYRSC